jgi:hypothetical protein
VPQSRTANRPAERVVRRTGAIQPVGARPPLRTLDHIGSLDRLRHHGGCGPVVRDADARWSERPAINPWSLPTRAPPSSAFQRSSSRGSRRLAPAGRELGFRQRLSEAAGCPAAPDHLVVAAPLASGRHGRRRGVLSDPTSRTGRRCNRQPPNRSSGGPAVRGAARRGCALCPLLRVAHAGFDPACAAAGSRGRTGRAGARRHRRPSVPACSAMRSRMCVAREAGRAVDCVCYAGRALNALPFSEPSHPSAGKFEPYAAVTSRPPPAPAPPGARAAARRGRAVARG